MIKITFEDGCTIEMPRDAFRRLLNISRARLTHLKTTEKSQFPKIDLITLNIIESIQAQYTDLI